MLNTIPSSCHENDVAIIPIIISLKDDYNIRQYYYHYIIEKIE